MKILGKNKQALFNYELIKKYQAGLSLLGWEVKSIKNSQVSLQESYIKIRSGEAFLVNMYVTPWQNQRVEEVPVTRDRKLLLKKHELKQLIAAQSIKGQALIPITLYLDRNLIKLELAVAKGKKKFDKRAVIKERDMKRQVERDLKQLGY